MQSSFSVLVKNLKNLPNGLVKYAGASSQAYATKKKWDDRRWNHGPQCIKDQAEVHDQTYHKRAFCQDKNMWTDKDLHTEVSQKDLAQLHGFLPDFWRGCHMAWLVPMLGGYGLIPLAWALSHDTWTPSTFAANKEQLKEHRKAIDLYRYKFAPSALVDPRWYLEFCGEIPERGSYPFEETLQKNDVRRDPTLCAEFAPYFDRWTKWSIFRRKMGAATTRAHAIPTFPLWSKMCMQSRLTTYWDLAFNEDYMVITQNLVPTFTEEEAFDYAWRRFLTPVDKELSHEQVVERINDYLKFVNHKNNLVDNGKAPNLHWTIVYVMGNYVEPGYLEEDIAELEKNDYDNIKDIPQDAFLKRLEFENGPLRDQVEAHTQKLLEERKKAAAAAVAQ